LNGIEMDHYDVQTSLTPYQGTLDYQ
jgi:hypothetical protein